MTQSPGIARRKFGLWYALQLGAATTGACLSIYLALQHTRLKLGIQQGASFCSLGKGVDCDVVNSSQFSELFGLPIASFGALYFLLSLLLSIAASPRKTGFGATQRAIGWLALVALFIDLGLFAVSVFILKNVCLLCMTTYLCSAVLFVSTLRLAGEGSLLRSFAPTFWQGKKPLPATATLVVASMAFLALGALVFAIPSFIRPQAPVNAEAERQIEEFFAKFEKVPPGKLAEEPEDGVMGSGPVQLVAFSDYQCPFCRQAAFALHTMLAPYDKRVRFVFKNFPLDSTCNPYIGYAMHPHACYLARLGACAAREGRFKAFHDRVFLEVSNDNFAEGREVLAKQLVPLMNEAAQKACLADESTLSAVRASIDLGRSLDVKGTPSFFLDGKPVTIPLTSELLERLVKVEEKLQREHASGK